MAGFKNNGLTDSPYVFWVPIVGPLIGGLIGAAASWWRETWAIELIRGHSFRSSIPLPAGKRNGNVVAYTELCSNVRAGWYSLPDICVFSQPDPQERYNAHPAVD